MSKWIKGRVSRNLRPSFLGPLFIFVCYSIFAHDFHFAEMFVYAKSTPRCIIDSSIGLNLILSGMTDPTWVILKLYWYD